MGYFDDFTRSQFVIPAADLEDMDGGTISSIKFYTSSSNIPYTSVSTVDVYIKEVDYTSISAFEPKTDDDIVYQGTLSIVTEGNGGSLTIEFSTPYTYDGGNLLVAIENTTDAGYKFIYFYGQTVTGASVAGSHGSSLASVNPTQRNFIPKTTFTYTLSSGPTCPKPETLVADPVTAHDATLTWTGGSGEYNVQYKEYSDEDWTDLGYEVPYTSYSFSDHNHALVQNTTYNFRVQSYCGTDPETGDDILSSWKTVSFTTPIACPVPTAVTVRDVTAYTAQVSWISEASSFNIMLGETLIENVTSPYTLNNLTPETAYTVKVKAICGGIDGESEWTSSTSFTTAEVCPDGKICIGTGTNTSTYLPANNYFNYSLTEQIYTAAEIGEAGAILSIDFYKASTTEMVKDLVIYMVSTTKDEFTSTTDWIPVTANDVVYSGTVTFTDNAWTTIELDNPFVYDGTSNVCIVVDNNTGSYKSSTPFRVFTTEKNQALYYQSDSNNPDPTGTPPTASARTTSKNRVRLAIGEPPACPKPTGLAVNYEGGTTAEVSWTSDATAWNIEVNGVVTEDVTNPYTLTDLELATTYEVRVQANCGGKVTSDWTSPVSFTTDLCLPENQCNVTFELTDSYGDGWNGAYIEVVDVLSEASLGTFTNQNLSKAAETETYTLAVCDGRSIKFVWHSGNYDSECSFVILDVNEEVIVSGTSSALPFTHTVSCTVTDCRKPTNLVSSAIRAHSAVLSWTENGVGEEPVTAWVLAYKTADDETFTEVNATENPFTLENLAPETEYTWKVRSNGCDDMWSEEETFTTLEECPTPTNVTVSNIGHYSADVNWTGDSESFNVAIGTIDETRPFNTQNFEDESLAAFANDETNPWVIWNENPNNGSFCMASGNYNVSSSTATITLTAEFASDGIIEFYSRVSSEGGTYDYGYFSIDGVEQYREGGETPNSWTKRSYEVSAGSHTFSWSYRKDSSVNKGEDRYFIDDVVLSTATYAWTTYTTETNAYSFEGLLAGTLYKVKVTPSCDETSESDIVSFTTVSENEKYFITEGDWGTAANWEPAGAPTISQSVELRANVTITGEAFANTISQGNYTINIEDGAKLKSNSSVTATVKKTINPWTENGGYYLIANPTTSNYTPKADGTDGILAGNFDLYNWDYTQDDEWRNYKANAFSSLNSASYTSYGYLYANENGTELIFNGTIKAANASLSKSCSAPSSGTYDFPGWFLLGNAFVCDAYLAAGSATGNALPFIRMKADGTGFENVAAGSAIAPLEGVFFQASSEEGGYSGTVYVTTTQPTVQSEGKLNMNLRRNNKQLDNAILVFGGNQRLGKMSFRANSSKIYMPVEGKNYAITTAESNMGEMPVSFKAETNGSYTLSFNAEEVSFAYLHLIDNMTGVETDLLANPSYSFEASTTDYASRFKLVFATGNNGNDDDFAFFSNGSFVINNEGNATLQVVDVTGRIIKSESINGCANVNVNAAPGVYMLRLVNGDNVKVQKVVVR